MKPFLHAEQALLGALLLDPAQMATVANWLATEHFYRPAHRALYAALLRAHAHAHPALSPDADDAARLAWLTEAVDSADDRAVTAAYAHTLVAACPRTAHATSYARIVLETSIRRSLSEQAARLRQAASSGSLDAALRQADELIELIADLRDRWTPNAPGPETGSTDPLPPLASDETVDLPPPSEVERSDEGFLLATLLDAPESLEELVGWLWPQDFAVLAHQRIYHCLGSLHHRGEPVDAITVVWEAERRGHLADGVLTSEQILGLAAGGTGAEAGYFGAEILRRALLRTAAIGARQIQRIGEQPAPAGRLLLAAFQALAPLQQARRRWRAAGSTAEERTPRERSGSPSARTSPRLTVPPPAPTRTHPAQHSRR